MKSFLKGLAISLLISVLTLGFLAVGIYFVIDVFRQDLPYWQGIPQFVRGLASIVAGVGCCYRVGKMVTIKWK